MKIHKKKSCHKTLLSGNIEFRTKSIKQDKERYFMIKRAHKDEKLSPPCPLKILLDFWTTGIYYWFKNFKFSWRITRERKGKDALQDLCRSSQEPFIHFPVLSSTRPSDWRHPATLWNVRGRWIQRGETNKDPEIQPHLILAYPRAFLLPEPICSFLTFKISNEYSLEKKFFLKGVFIGGKMRHM